MTPRTLRVSERGAVLVESSIVSMLFFFVIILVFQSAMFGRTHLAARDAATSGARDGAVAANSPTADYAILHAIDKSISSSSRNNIVRIVVFKPSGANYSMPTACNTAAVAGVCNAYTATDLTRPESNFGSGIPLVFDGYWPATSRSTGGAGGPDHLGVSITMKVGTIPGIYAPTITKSAIVTLEPHE